MEHSALVFAIVAQPFRHVPLIFLFVEYLQLLFALKRKQLGITPKSTDNSDGSQNSPNATNF
jgi:hypothetical protein